MANNTAVFRQNIASKLPSNNNKAISAVAMRETLESSANAIDDIFDTFSLADRLGTYNAATGAYVISETGVTGTLASTPAFAKGKYFDVTTEGTNSVTGTSRAWKIGDKIISAVTKWDALPFAIGDGIVSYGKLNEVSRKRMKGRNLLKNYRLVGSGTYPDNYFLGKPGSTTTYQGITAGASPNKFPVAKINVAAVNGSTAGFGIWYEQGVNVTALGYAGKSAKLAFYFKRDVAVTAIYLRPRNGAVDSTPIYTNYISQSVLNETSLIITDAFNLIDGTDVGYGIYVEMAGATHPNVAHIEISEITLRLVEDGDIVGTELNEDKEMGLIPIPDEKITYIKNAETVRKRLKGKNLLGNYRMIGTGTYPDTFTFDKTGTNSYDGITAGASPNKFPVAKMSVSADSGSVNGTATLYPQGVNVTALGHAGKSAKLAFYFKTDLAVSSLYLHPKNGSSPLSPIYTNYASKAVVGQTVLIVTDAFNIVDGTNVGYGIEVYMAAATYPNVAHVEISEVTLRLVEDGDIVGTELNEAAEIGYYANEKNQAAITAQITAAVLNPKAIALSLPEKIYAVQGKKLQVFKRSIMRAINPENYQLVVASSSYPNAKGFFFDDVYEYTPGGGDTSFPITFQLQDDNRATLSQATVTIVPTPKKTSPASPLRVLMHGDSFTASVNYAPEFARMLTGSGGSPIADGLTNIQFVGTTHTGTTVPREAIVGKTYDFFLNSSLSPFRNPGTSQMDIGYYCTQNGISGIDVAIIILGTNNMDSDAVIAAHWQKFLDYNPAMKILVGARIFDNPFGGWGLAALNLMSDSSFRNAFGFVKLVLDFNRRVEALTKTAPFLNKVIFVDILPTFDVENNMPTTTVEANTRNSALVRKRATDNVHPAASGYYQIADAMYAAFHANIL